MKLGRRDSKIDIFLLAGMEGVDSNTSVLEFEVTETIIHELAELARKLRRLGIVDRDGEISYERD